MVIKIFGTSWSPATQAVAVTLKEKNVVYEAIEVDFLKGEHKAPAFVKHQPFGQVPYMVQKNYSTLIFPFVFIALCS
jgi:glutathione S-transferase